MAGDQELILELFKQGGEFSTSEIVEAIYSKELFLNNTQKAKFHRRLIYHLNKLVDNRILTVSKYKSKGEKVFSVARDVVVELPSNKVHLSKREMVLGGLNLEKDAVHEFKPFGMMVNSLIINSSNIDLSELRNMLKDLYSEVNDVIAVHSIERIFAISDIEDLKDFFTEINFILNNRKLVFLINYNTKSIFFNKIIPALKECKNIELVLLLEENILLSKNPDLIETIDLMKDAGIKINVCKKNHHIIYPGNAGAYTSELSSELIKVVCTNSLCIDLEKIKKKSANKIKELLMKIVKELHNVNAHQQFEFEQLFPAITKAGGKFQTASNSLRFWNYDWKTDEYLLELLSEIKEEINEFTYNEENIYLSCGMPIKYKILFGSAFYSFDKLNLSARNYEKKVISNIDDLRALKKDCLNTRKKYFSLFDQGDRVRIFRKKDKGMNLINEFHYLILGNIPFFTYDFRGLSKEVNLRDFM